MPRSSLTSRFLLFRLKLPLAGRRILDEARRWIDVNRDVAAIIVEVESDLQSYEPFIRQIQARGLRPPWSWCRCQAIRLRSPRLPPWRTRLCPRTPPF